MAIRTRDVIVLAWSSSHSLPDLIAGRRGDDHEHDERRQRDGGETAGHRPLTVPVPQDLDSVLDERLVVVRVRVQRRPMGVLVLVRRGHHDLVRVLVLVPIVMVVVTVLVPVARKTQTRKPRHCGVRKPRSAADLGEQASLG